MSFASSDEINFLVYRYLQESGFTHTAFTFAHESLVSRSTASDSEVPPGALLSFLQKGLQYVEVESHLQEDGSERACDEPFHLLAPHVCRVKSLISTSTTSSLGSSNLSTGLVTLSIPEAPPGTHVPMSDVTLFSSHASEAISTISWNPKQDLLASGASDATARIWRFGGSDSSSSSSSSGITKSTLNADSPCTIMRHSLPSTAAAASSSTSMKKEHGEISSLEWSPDGSRLVSGCSDGRVRIWGSDGTLSTTLSHHTGPVTSAKWSPSGSNILSSSVDKCSIVWDANSGDARQLFSFHSAPVLDCEWMTDTVFATCSTDKMVLVCTVGEKAPTRTFSGHTDEVNSVAWSPSKTHLASGSDDGTVRLWTMANNNSSSSSESCLAVLSGGRGGDTSSVAQKRNSNVIKVAWSPTGEGSNYPSKMCQLASASFDGSVRLWDLTTLQARNSTQPQGQLLSRHTALVYSIAFSPDGLYLASSGADRTINVWNTNDGSLIRTFSGPAAAFDVQFSPSGNRLGVAFANGVTASIEMRR
jgi:transducin (beta)-like 1